MSKEVSDTVRLPDDSQRIVVIGRTGSGKTQFGLWLLSTRSFDEIPWIIFDYKGDNLIEEIDPIEIDFKKAPPSKPGLYVARPIPELDDEAVEAFLWKIWRRGGTGLYFDEGYMIPRKGALQGILTQGRSKEIPVIMLAQRPVWLSKFVWSEADFFVVFNLNNDGDRKVVGSYIRGLNANYRLPSFYSYFYDVGQDSLRTFQPVPNRDQILATYRARLGKRNRRL